MSAIAGIFRWDGKSGSGLDCGVMLRSLAIYGPDGSAQSTTDVASIGRCLLRRLPEDVFDLHPVSARNCSMVADIRLDNRKELIAALSLSREWADRSADSAILFSALERWGDKTLDRLVGDYAFAHWDGGLQRLLLARDPLGQRPLHFHRGRGFFAFASMPRGLHALPDVPYAPDLTRMADRIACVRSMGNRSFYAGIERVEPGHLLVATRDGIQTQRYWQPQRSVLKLKSTQEYADGLCEVLDLAVESRLRGSDDVGSLLSGGLDSTSVTAAAARLQASRNKRVVAFTAAPRADYTDPETENRFGDESKHAAAVADRHANVVHVVLRPDGRSPLHDLDANSLFYDKPLLNPCNAVWMHDIYAAASKCGIKILLVGDAGNATISYNGRALLSETFWHGRLTHWAREARALHRHGFGCWRGILRQTLGCRLRRELLTRPGRRRGISDYLPADSWDLRRDWIQHMEFGNENLGALAGWGIDRRDPTADRRVVEFCLSVPTEQYLREGVPAALLRRAMRERLPPIVLEERRKGLQAADWYESALMARASILAELEQLSDCQPVAERLNIPRLRTIVNERLAECRERPEQAEHLRSALLRGLSAGNFVRRVINGDR